MPSERRAAAAILLATLLIATAAGAASVTAPEGEGRDPALCRTDAGPDDGAAWNPLTGAIGFYQRQISSLRAGHCRFDPSCSEYARLAIRERGPLLGPALAADRLMRCNASAPRFYAPGSDGRLRDPVRGPACPPNSPRLPPWLLPIPDSEPPPGPIAAARGAAFARWLAERGECERAGTEYLRAAFTAGDREWESWARLQAGACLLAGADWPAAGAAFREAAAVAPTAGAARRAGYLVAATLFQAGRYAAAARRLRGLPEAGDEIPADALLAACGMARGRWGEVRRALARARQVAPDPLTAARLAVLTAHADRGPGLPRRSPGAATVMSAILPGSGQVYAGRTRDGLRHLVVDGALIYTVATLVADEHYPAAYLVGSLTFSFYLGNVLGANASARAYNRERRLQLTSTALAASDRP